MDANAVFSIIVTIMYLVVLGGCGYFVIYPAIHTIFNIRENYYLRELTRENGYVRYVYGMNIVTIICSVLVLVVAGLFLGLHLVNTFIPKDDVEMLYGTEIVNIEQNKEEIVEDEEIPESDISKSEDIIETTEEVAEEVEATVQKDEAPVDDDRTTFVAEWTPRLNSYLSGSPLSGYGESFAEAAYDYGVDPRYSAAISCIESGKGAHCFRSHNAWGWGNSSWSCWEEAIVAHTKGLASGYGYTVSESAAQKYCPPNWSDWYYKVCGEMSRI